MTDLLRQLSDLRLGDHVCMLYDSDAERLVVLVYFLRDGLARGERCVCAVAPQVAASLFEALAASGVDLPAERERGALVVKPSDEVYLRNGSFDPQVTRDIWIQAQQQALEAGFPGLCLAADVPEELGLASNPEQWIGYETDLNKCLERSRTRLLCLYDLRRFTTRRVLEILRTHLKMLLGRGEAGPERVRWLLDLVRRLQASDQEARVLHRATLAISGELDLDARLERVLDAALELTGAEYARIILEIPEMDEVELRAVRGALGQMVGYRQPRGAGLTGAVMEQNRPVRTGDAMADARAWSPEAVRRFGIRSWLGVPLMDGDHPFGVLAVVSEAVDRFSDEDEVRLLSQGSLAGSTIREARLRGQLERELSERKRAEETLFRREQELRAVVETAQDVITRIDRDLRYVYVNPAFERIMGLPADSMSGKVIGAQTPATPVAEAWRLTVQQVFRSGHEQTVELPSNAAGLERVFQVRVAPELGPDGRVEYVVSVGRDVTERTRREEEQARLYRELMEHHERLQTLVRRALLAREQELRGLHGLSEMDQLTRCEREILMLLAQGLTTRQIAAQFVIGPGTVKSHVERVLKKLGVANRAQAAARAMELGLLDKRPPLDDTGGGDREQESGRST